MSHEHDCSCCGYVWVCSDEEDKDKPHKECQITKASVVNKAGPFCHACVHGIMFIRYARHSNRNPQKLLKMLLIEEAPADSNESAGSEPQASLISSAGSGGIPEPAPNAGSKATR